jgi:F-type H+-transporting ATPase subunit b
MRCVKPRRNPQNFIAQAEKRAQQIVEEAKGTAKVEADKVVAGAKAEIEQEVERAKQQLRERVAELAVAGAEKILRKEINASAHSDMLAALKQDL